MEKRIISTANLRGTPGINSEGRVEMVAELTEIRPQDTPGEWVIVPAMRGENDALSLEYKLSYGCARGNADFTDFVNDPIRAGVCSILSLGLEK